MRVSAAVGDGVDVLGCYLGCATSDLEFFVMFFGGNNI